MKLRLVDVFAAVQAEDRNGTPGQKGRRGEYGDVAVGRGGIEILLAESLAGLQSGICGLCRASIQVGDLEAKIINRKLFPVEKAPFETSHKTGGRDLRIHKDLRLTARTPFGAIAPLAGQAPACASAPDKRRACQKTTPQAPIMENYFLLLPAKQSIRIYDSACIENRKDCLFPHCRCNDYPLLEKHRLCDSTSRYAGQLYSRAVDQGVTPDSCRSHPDGRRRQAERSVFFSRAEWKHAQGIRDRTPLRVPPVSCISFLRQPQYRIDIHRVL